MSFTYISKRGYIVFPSEHNIENNKGKYCVKFYTEPGSCCHSDRYFMVINDGKKENRHVTKQIECLEDFAIIFEKLKEGDYVI